MKLRTRIVVALATLALLVPASVVTTSAPAEATWGSGVQVQKGSNGVVISHMNGKHFYVGPGGYINDVASIFIPRNSCMAIGGYIYCAGTWGLWKTIWQTKTYSVSTNVA